MELRIPKNFAPQPSMAEINEKYARIIDKGNMIVHQSQKMKHEELMFKTHSYERFENLPSENNNSPLGGNLFVSGSSAPVCMIKERKHLSKKYKAPLPKTRRNKVPKNTILPLQGFGCTNLRYSFSLKYIS